MCSSDLLSLTEQIVIYVLVLATGVLAFVRLMDWLRTRIRKEIAEQIDTGATRDLIVKSVAEEVSERLAAERQRIIDDAVKAAERNAQQKAGDRAMRTSRMLNEEGVPIDPGEAVRNTLDLVKKTEPLP